MKKRASLLVVPVLLIAAPSWAKDYYVDAGAGNDANPGSEMAPFATVQAGLAAAMPGDTVILRDGSYPEAPQTVRDGTAALPITLRAEKSRGATVTAPGNVLTIRHAYHVIEGLVIDGQLGAGRTVRLRDASDHIVLRDLEVHHSGNNCVEVAQSDDVLIEKSSIHHCLLWTNGAAADAHGITGDAPTNLTVRDCEIYYCSGDAIQLSPPRDFWDNLLVERTVMWTGPLPEAAGNFQKGGIYGENAFDAKTPASGPRPHAVFRDVIARGFKGFIANQAAFNVKENVDFLIDRATVHDSELAFRMRGPALAKARNVVTYGNDAAVRYEDGIADLTFQNVTFADPLKDGGGADPVGMVFQNALFVAAAVPAEAASEPSNLAADSAFFINAMAGDYHLLKDAKAVDAGKAIAEVTEDRDGVPRPVGAAYDIGAHEWTDMPIGSGGTGGSGASSGGGGNGAGGAAAGAGGSAAGASGAGNGGSGDAEQPGGCGCRVPVGSTGAGGGLLLLGVALLALQRLSRRSSLW